MVVECTWLSLLPIGEIHGRHVLVRVEELVDGRLDVPGARLEPSQTARVMQQLAEVLAVNVVFEVDEEVLDETAHKLHLALERVGRGDEHRLERAVLIVELKVVLVVLRVFVALVLGKEAGADVALEVLFKIARGLTLLCPRGFEDDNAVGLDERAEGQDRDENTGATSKNYWNECGCDGRRERVELAKIARLAVSKNPSSANSRRGRERDTGPSSCSCPPPLSNCLSSRELSLARQLSGPKSRTHNAD